MKYLLMFAVAVAAEAPKTSPLKTAERMALQTLIAQRGEIEKQIQTIISEACETRGYDAKRCKLREDGQIVEEPEVKK